MPAIDVESKINDFEDDDFESFEESDEFGDSDEDSEEIKEPEKVEEKPKPPLKSVSNTRVGRKKKKEAEEAEKELTEKEKLAAAIDLKKSRELPRLPVEKKGGKVDKKTFFNWISLLTDSQWSRILVYCYRLFPKIDRTLKFPTGDKNIDIISEGITESDFIGRHGGGKYRFLVVDTESEDRDNKLFVCEAEWPWHETPPVVDYETLLLHDKDNKAYLSWATAKGILVVPTDKKEEKTSVDPVTQRLLDTFLEERKQKPIVRENPEFREKETLVTSLIGKLLESNSPDKQLTMVTQLMSALKPATPEFSLRDILEMQRKEAEARETLILKFLSKEEKERERVNETKEEPKTLLEQIEEAKKLAKLFGEGNNSGGTDWVEKLAPFLQAGVAMLGQFLAQRNNPGITQPQPQQQISPFAPTLPVATNSPNPVINSNNPVSEVPQEMFDPREQMLKQAIAAVAQPMINTINKGESGFDFAIWVIEGYGRQIYDMVSSVGSEKLLQIIQSMPEIWGYIESTGNQNKFAKLINEFCNRDEVDKIMAGEEETEEVSEPKRIEDIL